MLTAALTRRDATIAVAAFAMLVAALPVVPRWVSGSTQGVSAALAEGYNTGAAFWTVVVWSLIVVATFAWRHRRVNALPSAGAGSEPDQRSVPAGPAARRWLERGAVFFVASLAYSPLFLARYAPYSEDVYFLTALGRLDCGQVPYQDFGFLYGPLMLYLPWGWSQIFGVGVASYFAFLSLFEGLQFAIVIAVLQRLVPSPRERYAVFAVLAIFLYNNLFGLNYNGARWLVPALAVLLTARRPSDRATAVWCAVLLGLHLAYSHEYAVAALVAITAIFALVAWRDPRAAVRAWLTIGGASIAIWAAVVFLLLGTSVPAYVQHVREIVSLMASGHAGFRFFWTANSLALFGLLTLACVIVGATLGSGAGARPGPRFLIGAVVFTLVALKSGLTRADLWHLEPPFLPLLLAFVLPWSSGVLLPQPAVRTVARGLVAVAAATFLIGIAPMASLHAVSLARGVRDAIGGRALRPPLGHDLHALAQFLTDPDDSPVLFYGRAWALSSRIGVCPAHYKLDDLMYSEFLRPEAEYLASHPETRVVIRRDEFAALSGGRNAHAPGRLALTPMKQIGRWLSTVHYDAADTEARLQNEARARLTGDYLRRTYEPAAAFGEYLVLKRR